MRAQWFAAPMLVALFFPLGLAAQTLTGTVLDDFGEPAMAATVQVLGQTDGVLTDLNGAFALPYTGPVPVQLLVRYAGLADTLTATQRTDNRLQLKAERVLEGVDIQASRVPEKLMESAVTVESMGLKAIRETPGADFYESLGNLKGVDVTSASMGFKIINTRGFNSTSPVRSLQLIDGVDNQSPGLNFSLGNLVGASELDLQSVELVVGASSALYGPGAFNGVIDMKTRDPFIHRGLSTMVKGGERQLFETAVRYAAVLPPRKEGGREWLAFKLNLSYMRANDWPARNLAPTDTSLSGPENPGGYDAINRYGDENQDPRFNNFSSGVLRRSLPGLGIIYRTGYEEPAMVDYNTYSLKGDASLHAKLTDDLRAIYRYKGALGTAVYQGDNRYSLKDFAFQQHSLELRHSDRWHARAYYTTENAGNSYDAVFASLMMQWAGKDDEFWSRDYEKYWSRAIIPEIRDQYGYNGNMTIGEVDSVLALIPADVLQGWHNRARAFADDTARIDGVIPNRTVDVNGVPYQPRLLPGSEAYNQTLERILANPLTFDPTDPRYLQAGARFIDRSSLIHAEGAYRYPNRIVNLTFGGRFRRYMPNSQGTIFSDTLLDPNDPSQGRRDLSIVELGAVVGLEKRLVNDRLLLEGTVRLDWSQNFDPLVSPAASAVWTFKPNNRLRLAFNAALRNPTLADQYLFYNVGRAILIGNVNGVDSVVTLESLFDYLAFGLNRAFLDPLTIDPIRPERAYSLEMGYKGSPIEDLFIDASVYGTAYDDFIGFRLVAADPSLTNNRFQVFRVSANAEDRVYTYGASVGVSYYVGRFFELKGNYSWNRLDKAGSQDPLIPAFNTPEHKFNVGFNGLDIDTEWQLGALRVPVRHWGFNLNVRWVQGFLFEGSPQFTGPIDTYWTLDAQINKRIPRWDLTVKLGASNLLDQRYISAYGGPEIGRLAYVQLLYEPRHY